MDLVFTPCGTAPALAAKRATTTIPMVVGAAGDPVKAGIVSSLARPGANITGVSSLALELEGKRLELVKEVAPRISRVGVLWHAENPYSVLATPEVEDAARALGVRIVKARLSGAADLEPALAALKRSGSKRSSFMAPWLRFSTVGPSFGSPRPTSSPPSIQCASTSRRAAGCPMGANVDEISRR